MKSNKLYILLFTFFLAHYSFGQQRVGLVLSGGGATGLSHIGVIKALEENGIPIDYITGTSAGALVGSLYSAGYSPEEMEAMVTSEDFYLMAMGELRPEQHFLLQEQEINASVGSLSINLDSSLSRSLPTNLNSSSYLDFEMMKLLGTVSASHDKDFDSLFVPFRCVASDIVKKESVVFDSGDLNAAVRASMTYPFYFHSIRIDDVLLFDGGLYNNFPSDVLYKEFSPDYIIGSNVTNNAAPPSDDDLIGQLTNMLVRYTDFNIPCAEGIIITPESSVSSFDFSAIEQAINDGYVSTLAKIDSIRSSVSRKVTKEELALKRQAFRSTIQPIVVSEVTTSSKSKNVNFVTKSLIRTKRNAEISEEEIEKRYFRVYAAPQIEFLYPTLTLKDDSTYTMHVDVQKAKDIEIEFGGQISSRPVNMGYIGVSYQTLGNVNARLKGESYFGKFYGSAKASLKLDFPSVIPISARPYFTLNRWDYFRSFATFFEDVQPSFLVQNEIYSGVSVSHPLGNNIVSAYDARGFQLENSYYQTENFTNSDTLDVTNFNGTTFSWTLTQNSLNRKQFANSGDYFQLKARFVQGREYSVSGSTAAEDYEVFKDHQWINLAIQYQSFIIDKPRFHLGIQGQMVFNSQTLFANYTASILSMTEFSLVPDLQTFFIPEYRSPQFIGGGFNTIFTIKKKFDLRLDTYLYQPFIQLIENEDGSMQLSEPLSGGTFIGSASAIYNSFIGPIRFTMNYFPILEQPFELQFSVGYVIFNERAIR